MSTNRNREQCDSKIFWGDITADEHVVQIYDGDVMLLNTLANYALDGLYTGDSVIIIATKKHIAALNDRLEAGGLSLGPLISADQYIHPLRCATVMHICEAHTKQTGTNETFPAEIQYRAVKA